MEQSEYHGFLRLDFEYQGREVIVVCPKQRAAGNPWVWRAEFFGAFDTVDVEMLNRGWHVVYYQVSNMYGCPEAISLMKTFHDFVTVAYGLSQKADIFGFSRGGLYAVNYALRYPQEVSTLYLDAPVVDLMQWPRESAGAEWAECKAVYGIQEDSEPIAENPISHLEELAATQIPVILVAGDADQAVHYERNGKILVDTLERKGSEVQAIVKPGCDHHPHSLEDPTPVANFIARRRGHCDEYTLEPGEWTNAWYERPSEDRTRVMLIGDSITYGYRPFVHVNMGQEVCVNMLATSKAVDNPYFIPELDFALDQYGLQYDLIHFNNGLHGHHLSTQAYAEEYERVIRHLLERYPDAKLCLALSTPCSETDNIMVIKEDEDRTIRERNAVVVALADKYHVAVDDLYEAMLPHPEYHVEDGCHFTDEGREQQGRLIAEFIRRNLGLGEN